MARCTKTFGQLRHVLGHASFQFVDLPAFIALEVMMVLLAGNLVARAIARYLYRLKPSVVDKRLNIPIHGRDPECCMATLRCLQSLFRSLPCYGMLIECGLSL
jgi:hypothetical protein